MSGAFCHFSEAEEKERERESLPARESQGRPGSAGRILSLLRCGPIRGGALEAQGERLKIRLALVENREVFGWERKSYVYILANYFC